MVLHEFDLPVRGGAGWLLLDYLTEQRPRTKVIVLSGRATAGEAALEVDPLLESVYRQLMYYHYYTGDKGQALKVYRNCEKLFDGLFGEGPTPQTRHLFEAISNNAELDRWDWESR